MEIPIDKDWLKTLHQILIRIYQGTDDPISSAIPLVQDYDESLIDVCVKRHNVKVYGKTIYPHILQKASVLMHSIISFHPFVDGNKRTALLSTDFYLHWNGYDFAIPNDADIFTISVAKGEQSINDILLWLERNSKRTPLTVINHWLCESFSQTIELTIPKQIPRTFFSRHALIFFRNKIIDAQYRKAQEKRRDK